MTCGDYLHEVPDGSGGGRGGAKLADKEKKHTCNSVSADVWLVGKFRPESSDQHSDPVKPGLKPSPSPVQAWVLGWAGLGSSGPGLGRLWALGLAKHTTTITSHESHESHYAPFPSHKLV